MKFIRVKAQELWINIESIVSFENITIVSNDDPTVKHCRLRMSNGDVIKIEFAAEKFAKLLEQYSDE